MGVTNYHTINGRIVGQTKDGVRTHYVPDALGSVVTTVDDNGAIENTYRYKPYGSMLAKTGNGTDPAFLWVGAQGYRSRGASQFYVRTRHFAPTVGQWTSVDSEWPFEPSYTYVGSRPTAIVDPTGSKPRQLTNCPSDILKALERACASLNKNKADKKRRIAECMKKKGFSDPPAVVDCIAKRCDSNSSCLICNDGKYGSLPKDFPPDCAGLFPCIPGGYTGGTLDLLDGKDVVPVPKPHGCQNIGPFPCEKALEKKYPGCDTIHIICLNNLGKPRSVVAGLTWLHEIAHGCTRLGHQDDPKGKPDFIEALECCICLSIYDPKTCKQTRSCP